MSGDHALLGYYYCIWEDMVDNGAEQGVVKKFLKMTTAPVQFQEGRCIMRIMADSEGRGLLQLFDNADDNANADYGTVAGLPDTPDAVYISFDFHQGTPTWYLLSGPDNYAFGRRLEIDEFGGAHITGLRELNMYDGDYL